MQQRGGGGDDLDGLRFQNGVLEARTRDYTPGVIVLATLTFSEAVTVDTTTARPPSGSCWAHRRRAAPPTRAGRGLTLDGDVLTGTVGVDGEWAWRPGEGPAR